MIDQILDKLDMVNIHSGEKMNQEGDLDETEEEYLEKRDKAIKKAMGKDVDEVLSHEQKKVVLENAISAIKKVYPELTRDIFKAYIDTHYTDLLNDPSINVADDFMEWAYINGYMDTRPEDLEEKKGKDHDGDGDVDSDDYMAAKDKAIKKAMGKDVDEAAIPEKNITLADALERYSLGELLDTAEEFYRDQEEKDSAELAAQFAKKFRNSLDAFDGGIQEGKLNELRGSGEDIIEIIKAMAMEMDGDEIEAAMEVMEFIGEEFKIDFEFGRAGGGNYGRRQGNPYEGKINEAVKNIVSKVFEEKMISEAATNDLAKIAEDYGDFEGLKPAIIALENIVTEIESFYDKTRGKIQKIYNDLGEVRNEEGLKVGAFIAPSIENAFKRDLRPITKQQFHGGLEMPKVKRISESDPVMRKPDVTQMEAPKETVFTPINEKKK